MHIPDGFLSAPVWASLDVVSVPVVGYLARRAQQDVEETRIPLLGVLGAFVFAAQMINFPVGVGTSGHLVGAALLAFTLGPAAAAVVMTAILAVQALIFQDGGILALGANVCNMAILGVLAAYLPFHLWGAGPRRKAAIFLGGFFSVLVGACMAVSMLLISGVPIRNSILVVQCGFFLVNAILEGAITLAVMESIEALNPGWIRKPTGSAGVTKGALAAVAILLAVVGVLFASTAPDGIERFLEQAGIASHTKTLFSTPLTDYELHFFDSAWLRKASAGVAGLIAIYVLCVLLGRYLNRRRRSA